MVLDEPSSNLDEDGIEELHRILALWKEKGRTIIVAEHRLYYLSELADRMILLKDGKIVREFNAQYLSALTEAETQLLGIRSLHKVPLPEKKEESKESDRASLVCSGFDFHYKHSENGIRFQEKRFLQGKITAVVGKNGAGKSTFARVLCGLEKRAKGSVLFDGKNRAVRKRPELCYMIMQDVNHQLFTDSVLEEVMLSMPASVPEEQRKEQALAVLEKLDLRPLADIHPMALSGGQKQRVAIAGGIVSDAPVLLFDEPTSGLDLRHMKQVAALFRLLKEEGRTVIVITHDTELVREAADDIVSMP